MSNTPYCTGKSTLVNQCRLSLSCVGSPWRNTRRYSTDDIPQNVTPSPPPGAIQLLAGNSAGGTAAAPAGTEIAIPVADAILVVILPALLETAATVGAAAVAVVDTAAFRPETAAAPLLPAEVTGEAAPGSGHLLRGLPAGTVATVASRPHRRPIVAPPPVLAPEVLAANAAMEVRGNASKRARRIRGLGLLPLSV